ncbi:MAG: hypothetical protein RLY85_842, partial [Bacteroidota bacterium]
FEVAELVEEMVGENAEKSATDLLRIFPAVWDLGIGESECLLLDFNHPISIVYPSLTLHQGDFVIIAFLVGYGIGF